MNRKRLRILRWVEFGCLLGVLFVCGAIMWPVFLAARTASGTAACLSNIKQLAIGELLYANDNDDRLPPTAAWMDCITKYVKYPEAFHCPSVKGESSYGYAMNLDCGNKKDYDDPTPAEKVLLFESILLERNATSGVYDLPDPPRHNGRNCVAYLDGHVKSFEQGRSP